MVTNSDTNVNNSSGISVSKKVARFIIGTSTAGWTENDCDYLCDGTADDVEINTAIQALPENGGKIIILDGTYNITTNILVNKDNINIIGQGNSTVFHRLFSVETYNGIINLESDNCTVDYLSFTTANFNQYSCGIYITGNYSAIQNCLFDSHYSGVKVTGSYNIIQNNVFIRTLVNNSNLSSTGVVGENCNCVKIINNFIDGGRGLGAGIRVYNSYYIIIKGNSIKSCTSSGISIYNSTTSSVVEGNICYDCKEGLFVYCRYTVINGNTCYLNDKIGIRISTSESCSISGNICKDNGTSGIEISGDTRNCTISNNTITRGQGYTTDYSSSQYTILVVTGMSDTSTPSNNVISGNNIMGKNYNGVGMDNLFVNNKYN